MNLYKTSYRVLIGLIGVGIIIAWTHRTDYAGGGPSLTSPEYCPLHHRQPAACALLDEACLDDDPEFRFAHALDYIWWRGSRCGRDKNWRIIGPAGEDGEYRITGIFVVEVQRISGYVIERLDNASCRTGIALYLAYWVPRVFPQSLDRPGPATIQDIYELYRRGPTGYREWREALETDAAMRTVARNMGAAM